MRLPADFPFSLNSYTEGNSTIAARTVPLCFVGFLELSVVAGAV